MTDKTNSNSNSTSNSTSTFNPNSTSTFNVGHFFSLKEVNVPFSYLSSGTSSINGEWQGINVKYTNKNTKQQHNVVNRHCGFNGCKRHIVSDKSDVQQKCNKCKQGNKPNTEKDVTFVPNPWVALCKSNHVNYIDRSLLNIPFNVSVDCACGLELLNVTRHDHKMRFENVNRTIKPVSV